MCREYESPAARVIATEQSEIDAQCVAEHTTDRRVDHGASPARCSPRNAVRDRR